VGRTGTRRFINLDKLVGVRFGRTDGGEVTASCETAGGLSRRYEGAEALALREALPALCVHATAEQR
jgi:hypothetical protein